MVFRHVDEEEMLNDEQRQCLQLALEIIHILGERVDEGEAAMMADADADLLKAMAERDLQMRHRQQKVSQCHRLDRTRQCLNTRTTRWCGV